MNTPNKTPKKLDKIEMFKQGVNLVQPAKSPAKKGNNIIN